MRREQLSRRLSRSRSGLEPAPERVIREDGAAFLMTIGDEQARWLAKAGDRISTDLRKRLPMAMELDMPSTRLVADDCDLSIKAVVKLAESLCPRGPRRNSVSALLAADQSNTYREAGKSLMTLIDAYCRGEQAKATVVKAATAFAARTARFVDFYSALPRPDAK
jgi:hypothetical protein